MIIIGGVAGEGYGYLKSPMWWSGMILSKYSNKPKEGVFFFFFFVNRFVVVVVGEACNFVAYAFTQAILVTPLGALSVVLR
jgi:hypothetical protein